MKKLYFIALVFLCLNITNAIAEEINKNYTLTSNSDSLEQANYTTKKETYHIEKETYETIPIVSLKVLPLIKVILNGHETYFLVDSGASSTVLDINSRRKMGFDTFGRMASQRVEGIGGNREVMYVHNAGLYLGDIKVNSSMIAVDLANVVSYIKRKTSYRISGILGTDTMKTYNIVIDYGNEVCMIGIPD